MECGACVSLRVCSRRRGVGGWGQRWGHRKRLCPDGHLVFSLEGARVLMLISFLGHPLLHVWGSGMRLWRLGGLGLEVGMDLRAWPRTVRDAGRVVESLVTY